MTMRYSFDRNREGVVFANMKDINASNRDLSAVCTAIRYKSVPMAMHMLDSVIEDGAPILYRRHNTHMGHRHELGGRKGRYPIKCARIVKKVLVNVAANARSKGLTPDALFVIHASANKTQIAKRGPSKGTLFTQQGIYGYQPARSSNIELARVELGIASPDAKGLSENMKQQIKRFSSVEQKFYSKKIKDRAFAKSGAKMKKGKDDKKEEKKADAKKPEQKKDAPKPSADPVKKTEQKAEQKAEAKRDVAKETAAKEGNPQSIQHKGTPG